MSCVGPHREKQHEMHLEILKAQRRGAKECTHMGGYREMIAFLLLKVGFPVKLASLSLCL